MKTLRKTIQKVSSSRSFQVAPQQISEVRNPNQGGSPFQRRRKGGFRHSTLQGLLVYLWTKRFGYRIGLGAYPCTWHTDAQMCSHVWSICQWNYTHATNAAVEHPGHPLVPWCLKQHSWQSNAHYLTCPPSLPWTA